MGLNASFYICMGVAAATVLAAMLGTWRRSRTERRTIEESFARMGQITEWVLQLLELPEKERAAMRRAIVKEILLDAAFIHSMLAGCDHDAASESDEVRERRKAAVLEVVDLILELRKTQFVFRFRPKMVADCRRIYKAIEGHYRAWIAFIHLLKAKYPERYGELSVPELSDETPC